MLATLPAKANVISANRLADGTVVFFAPANIWVEHLSGARPYASKAETEAALTLARQDEASNFVVDVYDFAVKVEAGAIIPVTLRDSIRAAGPTIAYSMGMDI